MGILLVILFIVILIFNIWMVRTIFNLEYKEYDDKIKHSIEEEEIDIQHSIEEEEINIQKFIENDSKMINRLRFLRFISHYHNFDLKSLTCTRCGITARDYHMANPYKKQICQGHKGIPEISDNNG